MVMVTMSQHQCFHISTIKFWFFKINLGEIVSFELMYYGQPYNCKAKVMATTAVSAKPMSVPEERRILNRCKFFNFNKLYS